MNKQLILNSDACFILIKLMFQSDRSEVLIRYTASGQQTPFQMFALRWGGCDQLHPSSFLDSSCESLPSDLSLADGAGKRKGRSVPSVIRAVPRRQVAGLRPGERRGKNDQINQTGS